MYSYLKNNGLSQFCHFSWQKKYCDRLGVLESLSIYVYGVVDFSKKHCECEILWFELPNSKLLTDFNLLAGLEMNEGIAVKDYLCYFPNAQNMKKQPTCSSAQTGSTNYPICFYPN